MSYLPTLLALFSLASLPACREKSEPAAEDTSPPQDTQSIDTGQEDTSSQPEDTADPCGTCTASSATASWAIDPSALTTDAARTRNNALKGFMTSYLWGEPVTDFPDQLEFLYLPMSELWNENGETLDTGLEPYLVAAADRGHHATLRVFVDYPNRDPGIPDYLSNTVSCQPYTDFGGGCSPDYDHPELVSAMLGLIEALGTRYDGDPRLGFVQVGLLGFWGEWHTWPHTDWFPSDATQTAVLEAFDAAFETTELQVRRAAVNTVDLRIGFHDDSFAYSTIGETSWFFLPGLETAGAAERWKEVAVGGELRPEIQPDVFSQDYVLGTYAQDVVECIEQTHASYLLNYHAFNGNGQGYLGQDRILAEEAALKMGYQFELVSAALTGTGLLAQNLELSLEVTLKQTGVAPFYYPLFLELHSDALASPIVSTEDLQGLLPGEELTFQVGLGQLPVTALQSPISLQLSSPMLQENQEVLLATSTPWSPTSGPTALSWETGCRLGDVDYQVGDVQGASSEGCDCTCDVDGVFRTCDGASCE